ncbi:hypothetical protein D3C72_999460 [compost metagenome]
MLDRDICTEGVKLDGLSIHPQFDIQRVAGVFEILGAHRAQNARRVSGYSRVNNQSRFEAESLEALGNGRPFNV